MTEEEDARLMVAVEALEDGVNLGDSDRLRLIVEGDADKISALAELVVAALGGVITRATSYGGPEGEKDVTAMFVTPPEVIDPLSTGDDSE
jgi:hypothetical protein